MDYILSIVIQLFKKLMQPMFNVKNVESVTDITIISPPSMRAAMAGLREM